MNYIVIIQSNFHIVSIHQCIIQPTLGYIFKGLYMGHIHKTKQNKANRLVVAMGRIKCGINLKYGMGLGVVVTTVCKWQSAFLCSCADKQELKLNTPTSRICGRRYALTALTQGLISIQGSPVINGIYWNFVLGSSIGTLVRR